MKQDLVFEKQITVLIEKKSSQDILFERYIADLLKKDVDKFERAVMIREYVDRNKISVREFARRCNIPKSTIEDWLLYNRITEQEYVKLLSEGKNHKEIYKALRRDKKEPFNYSDLDAFLIELKPKIKHFRQKGDITPRTFVIIDEVVDALNNLSAELRLKSKKVRT